MSRMRKTRPWALLLAIGLLGAFPTPSSASHGFLTSDPPFVSLGPDAAAGSELQAIISVGEDGGTPGFLFEGIPDGIGIKPGPWPDTVDVFVTHEQSTVPFPPLSGALGPPLADFVDSSISKLTLDIRPDHFGEVLAAEVALPSSQGFLRFCSAFMAGPDEGFSRYTFFANEETNDIVDVPPGAIYGPDPALAPQRQGGYAVVLDAESGEFTHVPGMGRHNHENSVVIPGGWNQYAIVSTDDTFTATTSQLYMYLANQERHIWQDKGSLWAFRVTGTQDGPVDPGDPFNDANDYLDLSPGEDFQGEFIRVPKEIAKGLTDEAPQDALENWSVENNVFTFVRLEDLAYDRHDPRTVYIADTGATRVIPDPATGRITRGPSGTVGQADNGRIFQMVFNDKNPRKVDSLTVLAQGDDASLPVFVPFRAPDNIDTSEVSLMVQEDASDAKVWQHVLGTSDWLHVATVNDPDGESSGIVDASEWFGDGWWMLDVQSHGVFQESEVVENPLGQEFPDLTLKREDGQLLLMNIPGST